MLCKRMAPTLLALLLPLSLAALVSCGGNDNPVVAPTPPEPPPSGEAGITSLDISVGELTPAFSPHVNNYTATVGLMGETSIGVTVTLKDAKARLTVNGIAAASGAATNVALLDPINTVRVAVTAEDGRTSNAITLTVEKLPFNTRVWVLDGMGGGPVENTRLTLTDSGGKVLVDNVALPREKNGQPVFGLALGRKYNIYARGDGAAAACFANFDPAKEGTATLYCLGHSTTFYELEAPIIEEIAFATTNAADADWKTMANSAYYVGLMANAAAVRVTAITRNLIAVGFGDNAPYYDPIRINVDEVASANSGGATGVTGRAIETNVPITRDGRTYYRTTHRFDTPLTADLFNREHYLDVVVYDMIGNRTEQRVYMTIADSGSHQIGDADLTAVAPTWDYMQSWVYVGSGDYAGGPRDGTNALDPVDPYAAYQTNRLWFYVRNAGTTTDLDIRGFEVWRSSGSATNFVKVATVNYATATTGDPFSYADRTPSLAEGEVWYMLRAFNGNPANNGYSQFSVPKKGVIMPPTTTGPAASHRAVQGKLWPTFRIAASNPKMLNKDTSDSFRFTLFIKNATNAYPFLMIPFWVDFTQTEIIGNDPNSEANQHRYGFPLGKPPVAFRHATGYNNSSITAGNWYFASDSVTDAGGTTWTPFVYLDDDGSVVINTDSENFQYTMENAVRAYFGSYVDLPYFRPGVPYLWNLFGDQGGIFWSSNNPTLWTSSSATNAAYFTRGFNDAPYETAFLGYSIGSNVAYGLGSPEGWFTLIIDPDAE